MKNISYVLLLISVSFIVPHIFCLDLDAQTKERSPLLDSVINRIDRQLKVFPQEKIYTHVDKVIYLAGDTVWFRNHLVDASSHRYDTTSMYVYGELINPEGRITDRVKIIRKDGIYSGYFNLAGDLSEGLYTLCFYTKYMQNLDETYFAKRTISIVTSLSGICHIESDFEYLNKNTIKVNLHFTQSQSNQPFVPEELKVGKNKNELKEQSVNKNGVLSIEFSNSESKSINLLYIDYKYRGKRQKQYLQIASLF